MPIQFPPSPSVNQEYTYSGKVWAWDGSSWVGVRQETGIQKSNIWAKQNLLIPKRGFGLNSGYNGTTDQRRTKAGTIPTLKHYIERNLGEFLTVDIQEYILNNIVPVHWHLVTPATNVASWDDRSGNGWSATQGTPENQPTRGTDGGVDCLSFDGNDSMTLGNVMASATSGFYIGLIKFTSDPTAGTTTTAGVPYAQEAGENPVFWSSGGIYEEWGANTRSLFGDPTPSLTNWTIYQVENNGTSNGHIVRINGTVLGTVTAGVAWSATPRFGGNGTYFFNGKIAEIIALKRIPTQSEREYLEGYIAWRAGIASVLPNDHPYKSSAPTV